MLKQDQVPVTSSVQVPIATSSVQPVYTLKTKTLLCKHRRVEALIKASPFLLQDTEIYVICLWLLKQGILRQINLSSLKQN